MEQLSQLKQDNATEAKLRQQVLADPDIARIIEARKNNENFKIVADITEERPSVKEQIASKVGGDNGSFKAKMNELTNAEMIEVILPALQDEIKNMAVTTRGDAEKLADERFSRIENNQQVLHKSLVQQFALTNMDRLSDKYNDFTEFKDKTDVERKNNPSLGLEDAYLLAKAKAGSLVPKQHEVGTERPDSGVRRTLPKGRAPDRRTDYGVNKNRTSGDQQFKSMLSDAADTVLARRRGIN